MALINEMKVERKVNFSKMFCCFCSCKLTSQMTNEKNFTMQTLVQTVQKLHYEIAFKYSGVLHYYIKTDKHFYLYFKIFILRWYGSFPFRCFQFLINQRRIPENDCGPAALGRQTLGRETDTTTSQHTAHRPGLHTMMGNNLHTSLAPFP